MKVIFLQDIPHGARAGEIKEVPDGYARNHLIPKKLAALADASTLNLAKMQKELKERSAATEETRTKELAAQLEGREIIIKAKSGTKEQLYGSITTADIAGELFKSGLDVDKRKIELAEPIRTLGVHEVTIKLRQDLAPKVKVNVVALEKEGEQGDSGKATAA